MALADTFVRQVKHTGKPAGDKHTDGDGMYLLVKAGGKYWRMDFTHLAKRKTLALGVYPEVSLANARERRKKARELLADGIDPSTAKKADKQAKADAAPKCQVPCDHIPVRSWPFFRARALLQAVIASFKAEQHP